MWIIEAYPYKLATGPEEKSQRVLKTGDWPHAQKLWNENPQWGQRRLAQELGVSRGTVERMHLRPPPGREKYAKGVRSGLQSR